MKDKTLKVETHLASTS